MDRQFTLRSIVMIALVSTIIGIGLTPILSLPVTNGAQLMAAIEDGAGLRIPLHPRKPIWCGGGVLSIICTLPSITIKIV